MDPQKDGISGGNVATLLKQTLQAWLDDYAPSMGAALAYYTMFSLAPLLLIVVSVAGYVFGEEAARGEILTQLRGMLGEDGASTIEALLKSVSEPATSLAATAVGIIALLIGATTVFGELQDSLDRIWRAPAREGGGGFMSFVRSRLLSIGMILGLAFLLMVSLVFSAVLTVMGKWWGTFFGTWQGLLEVVNFVVSFALVTGMFALIYKLMPRVRIQWRDVWIGAAFTALLFVIGKSLIGLYIGTTGIASGFGAAASLVVILVWVYYSAQIFLFGAEFTWIYSHTFGSRRGQKPPDAPEGSIPARKAPQTSAA